MLLISCVLTILLHYASGDSLCGNSTESSLKSCTTQILGDQGRTEHDLCQMEVFPTNSPECSSMKFGPPVSNAHIGGVTLKPHVITQAHDITKIAINRTVLNITFSNIKWTTMRFRFQDKFREARNHCRNILISKDVTVDDRSVLYYDCYWPISNLHEDQSYILDFEANNTWGVYRGQYYFNVPSAEMLSHSVSEKEWKPFVYIEIFPTKMRLHIMPPPEHLKITGYHVKVMKKDCDKNGPCELKSKWVELNNKTDEVSYDYSYVGSNGKFYFTVTPQHKKCVNGVGCKTVESPKIVISFIEVQSLNICIASITALIVAALFAYYIVLRVFRRYCCKDYRLAHSNEIPTPPKVLVIYSPTNRLHAECVASFVSYLHYEYGIDIMYDGDISNTSHGDPYIWAEEAFRIASHIMYIVGPAEETNLYNNIYDKPIISPHRNVDVLLLSFVKANRVAKCPKDVLNVFFEYSNGQIPVETRHDKLFFLIKDWHKLIAYLSKNLLPKRQIMRTERGRSFLEDLTRAKKLLNVNADEVMVKCEKNAFDRKILL
ncbi:uncharacterized protein LOC115442813 [Manduca sexta]|uniref:SEFIR domain-containing protein n=1 Tax=Manduca sexta TaxID=7130 RepID=A0A921Z2G6_MANSE|nr:uncharacterized protein LOC115442813 [Manduca sexta]KAG6449019.1 hypothetical protein O3G_MSEX005826 [Manduca sexta]